MNDKDNKGHVSLENAMQIMYLRYGRQALDAQLEEIFGTSDLNSGRPNAQQEVHCHCMTTLPMPGYRAGPGQSNQVPFVVWHPVCNLSLAARQPVSILTCYAGKTLTLTEFLQSLHLSQVKQLRNRVTAKTYKPPPMEKRRTSAAA